MTSVMVTNPPLGVGMTIIAMPPLSGGFVTAPSRALTPVSVPDRRSGRRADLAVDDPLVVGHRHGAGFEIDHVHGFVGGVVDGGFGAPSCRSYGRRGG